MNLSDFKKIKIPDSPGVYYFKHDSKVLYIGKATSLKERVRSYFAKDLYKTRGSKIVQMVEKSNNILFESTDSVLEALLREAKLIRRFKPEYNTEGKDDKSYNCILITKEEFPRVLLVRENNLDDYPPSSRFYLLGPFPKGSALKEALQIIRKIFPFRDKCTPLAGKKCFNAQIGLCPSVCDGSISPNEYKKIIKKIILFLEGDKKKLIRNLEKEMNSYSKKQEFEQARIILRQINSLRHINDITLMKRNSEKSSVESFRIEAYDIAHLMGKQMVGVMVVITNGVTDKKEYRSFNIKTVKKSNDSKALIEVVERRFRHKEWTFPNLIVVDGNKVQLNAAKGVLDSINAKIEVVAVVKDEHHKAREIIGNETQIKELRDDIILANSEAHRFSLKLHKIKRDKLFIAR